MPQTILAVLAMMITITLSLNVQRQVVDTQRETIANELEVMATGVALQTMETIRSRAFDEVVAAAPDAVYGKSSFEAAPFTNDGDGNACKVLKAGGDVCDDLDDFHGMSTTMDFDMGGGESMPLEVTVDVQYVDAELKQSPAGDKSYRKEVRVYVQDITAPGRTPFLRSPIYISRVFAYNFNAGGQGHSGGSEGTEQGDGQGQFGQFMDWLMERLSGEGGDEFKSDISSLIGEESWPDSDKLISAIDKEKRNQIEKWMQDHEGVRSTIQEWWAEGEEWGTE